jgi:D-sedoheptulose 7-phosphate isomerase
MDSISFISGKIRQSVEVKLALLENQAALKNIKEAVEKITSCLKNGGKVLLCGNGGSAADAQHIAAELSGRFYTDREPLFAEALHVNTSYLTAVANDYSFNEVYSRLIRAQGRENDILIAISTSGNSPNILKAIEEAHHRKMITIGLTGETGGKMKDQCRLLIAVPSKDTPRIQESHILIGHIICEMVEKSFSG